MLPAWSPNKQQLNLLRSYRPTLALSALKTQESVVASPLKTLHFLILHMVKLRHKEGQTTFLQLSH